MARRYPGLIVAIVTTFATLGLSATPAEATVLKAWAMQINKPIRFKPLKSFNFEAVLDQETQLVWERSPGDTNGDQIVDPSNDRLNWSDARGFCADKVVGGRKGWRLPAFFELASLVDPSVSTAPTLPVGHPFDFVQLAYWSATRDAIRPGFAWAAVLAPTVTPAAITTVSSDGLFFVWCVRGGSAGPDQY